MYSKLFVSILLAASAQVQALPAAVPRQDYLTGLVQALNQANLTTLATVFGQYAATEQGQQVASALPNGNYTVLAPSNAVSFFALILCFYLFMSWIFSRHSSLCSQGFKLITPASARSSHTIS